MIEYETAEPWVPDPEALDRDTPPQEWDDAPELDPFDIEYDRGEA